MAGAEGRGLGRGMGRVGRLWRALAAAHPLTRPATRSLRTWAASSWRDSTISMPVEALRETSAAACSTT